MTCAVLSEPIALHRGRWARKQLQVLVPRRLEFQPLERQQEGTKAKKEMRIKKQRSGIGETVGQG